MPLVNSPTLTPKKLAANRINAQLSRGPITPEGLIRMRLRREDSSFRQIGRLTDLLLKLKREAWHAQNKKLTSKMKERPTMLLITKELIFYPTML
jgi:hypothetical protein